MTRLKNKSFSFLSVWFLVTVLWSCYRIFFAFDDWVEEILFKPLLFLIPVAFYIYKTEGKVSLKTLGFNSTPLKKILTWGLGFGIVLVAENIAVLYVKGFHLNGTNTQTIFIALIISLATAFSEEILFRGFLMENFLRVLHNPKLAVLYSAILFTVTHISVGIFRLGYTLQELMPYLLLMFVLGCAQGYIYSRTRSVVASGIAHTLWNFSNVFLK